MRKMIVVLSAGLFAVVPLTACTAAQTGQPAPIKATTATLDPAIVANGGGTTLTPVCVHGQMAIRAELGATTPGDVKVDVRTGAITVVQQTTVSVQNRAITTPAFPSAAVIGAVVTVTIEVGKDVSVSELDLTGAIYHTCPS